MAVTRLSAGLVDHLLGDSACFLGALAPVLRVVVGGLVIHAGPRYAQRLREIRQQPSRLLIEPRRFLQCSRHVQSYLAMARLLGAVGPPHPYLGHRTQAILRILHDTLHPWRQKAAQAKADMGATREAVGSESGG